MGEDHWPIDCLRLEYPKLVPAVVAYLFLSTGGESGIESHVLRPRAAATTE